MNLRTFWIGFSVVLISGPGFSQSGSIPFATSVNTPDQSVRTLLNNSWALKNRGESLIFDLSLTQAHRLQARAGEDLGLTHGANGATAEGANLTEPTPLKSKKIRVAVLDTGVDVEHPLIRNRISRNPGECQRLAEYKACLKDSSKGLQQCQSEFLDARMAINDTNQNQYPMDCAGWNVLASATADNILGTPIVEDEIGHGTHVASLIAEVSPHLEIIPVQVLGRKYAPNRPVRPFSVGPIIPGQGGAGPVIPGLPGGDLGPIDLSPQETARNGYDMLSGGELAQIVARGLIYAIESKVDIINLSIGWPQLQDHRILREAIAKAQANGIFVVAAAGNDSTSALLRPCQYNGVICVAATRPDGALASFSNFGYGVDVAAPGVAIPGLIPQSMRSIGIPGYFGIDLMSGTSQAAPLVSVLIAEMLSRGVPREEIYARLVLGSRPLRSELPVLVGPVHLPGTPVTTTAPYKKSILGGQVDLQRALSLPPQPLILSADKSTPVFDWDLRTKNIPFQFSLKNHFADTQDDVEVRVRLQQTALIMPQLISYQFEETGSQQVYGWISGEEKNLLVEVEIVDSEDAQKSKIPRELEFEVDVLVGGKVQKSFPLRAEIAARIDVNSLNELEDVKSIPLSRAKNRDEKFFLIDEVLDQNFAKRDYLLLAKNEKDFSIALAQEKSVASTITAKSPNVQKTSLNAISLKNSETIYEVTEPKKFTIKGNLRPTLPQYRIRVDLDFDGTSEYVFSLKEFIGQNEFQPGSNRYVMHVFFLNADLSLRHYLRFDDDRALMPNELSWIRVGNELRPAWVGQGYKVHKKSAPGAFDQWFGEDDLSLTDQKLTDEDIYLFYLDKNFELQQVQPPVGVRIVDVLEPTKNQLRLGQLPVLVARNLGTQNKPSYLNDFYSGLIVDEKLTGLSKLANLDVISNNPRNLIDTRKDRVFNLSPSKSEFAGNFWFGMDAHVKQRLTMLDASQSYFVDALLDSQLQVFDAPLRIRAAFTDGKSESSAFMMTNTEIQFHDLKQKKVVSTSLNKYTFVGDTLTVDLQFPLTLNINGKKRPALYTTEGSGLNSSMRVLTPDYDQKTGALRGIVSPARLSLKSPQGCRPLDFPFFTGSEYAVDFECGRRFIRTTLKF